MEIIVFRKKLLYIFFILFSIAKLSAQNWTQVNLGTNYDYTCVDYPNDSTIYIASFEGITKSTDGGATWVHMPYMNINGDTILALKFLDMHFIDSNIGLATGILAGSNIEIIYKTYDGGNSWQVTSSYTMGSWPRTLNDIEFINANIGFAVGTNGRILKTTNAGASWSVVSSNTISELKSICFINQNIGVIVGHNVILRTSNGGNSWTVTAFPNYDLEAVHFNGGIIGYAVGNVTLKTTNYGNSWAQINTNDGYDVFSTANDTAFLCYNNLLKTENQGQFWGVQPSIPVGQYKDIDFLNDLNGFIVGNNGKIYRTTTGGDDFITLDAGIVEITSTSNLSCSTPVPFSTKFKNFGTDTLTSLNLNWSLNGVLQNVVSWNGSVASNATSGSITLGNVISSGPPIEIKVWTSLPNGAVDLYFYNDTLVDTLTIVALQGSYTVGGVNPDYANLSAVSAALSNTPICGDLVFIIRDGVYNESVYNTNFNPNPNSNITFQSESGDSSAVIIRHNSNYVINISNANNTHFKGLTIVSNFQHTLSLFGNNVSVKNCVLIDSTQNTSNLKYLFRGSGNNIIVENCYFKSINRAIQIIGSSSNIQIKNCEFNTSNSSIEVSGSNAIIQYNIIKAYSLKGNSWGISVSGSGQKDISFNKISCDATPTIGSGYTFSGISINNDSSVFANQCNIYNNFIGIICNDHTSMGISIFNTGKNIAIYHNSVYLTGSTLHQFQYCLNLKQMGSIDANLNLRIVNNIFSNLVGKVILIQNTVDNSDMPNFRAHFFTQIDHNIYYGNTNSMFFLSHNNQVVSLAEWKNLFVKDSTFIYANPQFLNIEDLHFYAQGSSYAMSNSGIPIPWISVDIDGNLRSTSPDIGADEFDSPINDIEVYLDHFNPVFCVGNNQTGVFIVNHGQSSVDSVEVNWALDGIMQAPLNVALNIAPNDTSYYIATGNFNLTAGNHTLMIWANLIGSNTDYDNWNDSLTLAIVAGGMSGVYTIGAAPSDFGTIYTAVDALDLQGVCGPVIFDIKPGNYNEQIVLSDVAGASPINTITFRAQNGDSTSVNWYFPTNATNNFVIQINNGKYYKLENLSLSSTTASGTVIDMPVASESITIKGCLFSAPSAIPVTFIYVNEGPSNNLLIRNNRFTGAGLAINIENGPYLDHVHNNIVILDNIFYNLKWEAIKSEYAQSLKIIKNEFFKNISVTSNYSIYLNGVCSSTEISKNTITGAGNHIYLLSPLSSLNTGALISNNLINVKTVQIFSMDGLLYSKNMNNLNLINNSFQQQIGSTGAVINLDGTASNVNLYNNIIHSLTTGTSLLYHGPNIQLACDYNIFNCPQGFNLSQRQTTTPYDQHSYEGNPYYLSTNDLHLSNSSFLASNNGTNIFNFLVSDDIDAEVRFNTPDIGADEFNLLIQNNYDAGIQSLDQNYLNCGGSQLVKVVLKNYSNTPLTSTSIKWRVNGMLQPTYNWTGNLISYGIDSVSLGYFNFNAALTNDIKVWTEMPNGLPDLIHQNDTFFLPQANLKLSGVYTVGGSSPDYPDINSFVSDLQNYGICGPTTFLLRAGTYPFFNLTQINGCSAVNTISIKSESGNPNDVLISSVGIFGTDFLTIRDVSFTNNNYAIEVGDTVKHLNLIHNNSAGDFRCYTCSFDNITIDSSAFAASTQVYVLSALNSGKGFFFTNNQAESLATYNTDSVLISQNEFTNGITAESKRFLVVSKNRIIEPTITGITTTVTNFIPGSGIFNNEIIRTNNNVNQPAINSRQPIHHNSIQITSASNTIYAILAGPSSSILNNVISMANGKFISTSSTINNLFESNYNVFHSNGTFNFLNGLTTYNSLASYQNATSRDLNSLQIDPQFQSSSSLYPLQPLMLNSGSFVGVLDDINNLNRNLFTPTIGAYEVFTTPNVNLGPDTVFCGNQLLSASNPASNYLWSNGSTNQSILTSGSGYYWVTVSNSLGSDIDSIYVTVNPSVSIQLNTTISPNCENSCINFNAVATGGNTNYTYHWTPGNILSDSTIFNPSSCIPNQLYALVVTDQNGCSDSTSYFFETPQAPSLNIAPVNPICAGQTISLQAASNCTGCSYIWTPNQNIQSPNANNTLAFPSTNTMYSLTVLDNNGCITVDSIQVIVNQNPVTPVISLSGNSLICNTIADNYQWFYNGTPVFGATNNFYNSIMPGSYFVVVTNNAFCSDTSNVITYSLTVSINELNNTHFEIYPNPANDQLYCKIESSSNQIFSVELKDVLGNCIYKSYSNTGDNLITYDVLNLSGGLYFVNLFTDKNELLVSRKVVIGR